MNPIKKLPDLPWSSEAAAEIALTGQDLLDRSDFSWQIGQVAICGLVYSSYTSPPWFWFALAQGVSMRDLIDFRRLEKMIPVGAVTAVRKDRPTSIRFAKFYGFSSMGECRLYDGIEYELFRRV